MKVVLPGVLVSASLLGAVAWTVLTRAELAVYVQALQRRAHAPRIKDCKRLNVVIRYMKRHKCGLKSIALKHPLKLVAFTDAAFKAQPEESTGLALRGLAAVLEEDDGGAKPSGKEDLANLVDFTVRRQRRHAGALGNPERTEGISTLLQGQSYSHDSKAEQIEGPLSLL